MADPGPSSPGERVTVGTRLGPYLVVSALGSGGMGEVYRAKDTRLDREVAVKVLPPHLYSNSTARQRFEREAKAVAQLAHAHICALHDVGREGEIDYLVMDYLEGESLADRLSRGPLRIPEALVIGIQIAEALEHAHHAGVIHRDVKPGNVFLTKKGVKVLDFGLARRMAIPDLEGVSPDDPTAAGTGPVTEPGTILGTLAYMAPEQLKGKEADARTDIFAFGLVLFEMIAGTRPFSGATRAELMSSILRDPVRPLSEIVPGTPAAIERLLNQCLAKNPEDRWEAAHDLTNSLRWIRDEMSAVGSKPGASAPSRRPRWISFAVAGLAAAAAVFAAYTLLKRPASRAPAAAEARRIAVLPFENQGQTSEEYFSDGVSDEVRGKLASVPGIEVIARASSNAYKKVQKNLDQVAGELRVGYLLMGTVRWENPQGQSSRVHISPELVEIRAGRPPITRWQQNFDADLADVFELQANIAGRVVQAMNVVLSPPQQTRLSEKPTRNLEAWESYLRGVEIAPAFSDPASLRKAIAYYEHAVDLDSSFAQAWAMLSRAHSTIYENAVPLPADAAASKKAADQALALAPNRAESLLAAGYCQRYVAKDYARARESFEKAARLAPSDADVLVALADVDMSDGRRQDAVVRLKLARRMDPRSVRVSHRLVMNLLCLKRFREAQGEYEEGQGFAPRNLTLIGVGTMRALAQGDLPGARAVFAQAARRVDPKVLAVFLASYSDLSWVLSEADQDVVLNATPDAFDGDLSAWAFVQAEILWMRGEKEKAAQFARKASSATEDLLRESPRDVSRHALLGVAYAYLGLREKALAEAAAATAILPLSKDADRGAYIQLQSVRVRILLGEPERALDLLDPLLRIPFYVTPAWLGIDPTFDALRANPRFRRLVGQAGQSGHGPSSGRATFGPPRLDEMSLLAFSAPRR